MLTFEGREYGKALRAVMELANKVNDTSTKNSLGNWLNSPRELQSYTLSAP